MGGQSFFASLIVGFVGAAALAWLWSAEGDMSFRDAEYPMWAAKKALVAECRDWHVVILGDSRAMADLVPDRLGASVVNLALGGGTPIEMYYTARHLLQCPNTPRMVVLSFTVTHFMTKDIYWGRTADFHYLSFDEMEEVRTRSAALDSHLGIYETSRLGQLKGMIKDFLYSARYPMHGVRHMADNYFRGQSKNNREILDYTLRERGYHFFGDADGSTDIPIDTAYSEFKADPLFDDYMNGIVTMLDAKNVPVKFVAMPIHDIAYAKLSPALVSGFARYLAGYETRYPNFHVSGDPIARMPSRYFGDASHLNQRGAVTWSDQLRDNGTLDLIAPRAQR